MKAQGNALGKIDNKTHKPCKGGPTSPSNPTHNVHQIRRGPEVLAQPSLSKTESLMRVQPSGPLLLHLSLFTCDMRSVRGLLVKLLVALVVAALAAVLLVKFRDASLQHKLTGTWVSTNGTNAWSTSTIAGDGRFTAEIHDTNGHVLTLEGTEKVEFGYLRLPAGPKLGFLVAETDTKRDGTNVIPPCVSHDYIIRLTDQEYVENPEYYATNVTFKKVSQ